MRRPLALRCLPPRARQAVWSRLYRPATEQWFGLYESAPLHFARDVEMRLVPGDVISDSIAFTGVYELEFTKWLVSTAREEGGVLVDVGANLGYFSLLWAAQKTDNRTIAFEASPRNLTLLEHNVHQNGYGKRVNVRREAVGAQRGTMQFDLGPANQTGWGGFSLEASEASVAVDVVPLDDALLGVSDITLLKIDIEGADFWAIQGAQRILREKRVRHIWWEENKPRMRRLGIQAGDAQAFIRSMGYATKAYSDPKAGSVDWHAWA